MSTSPDLPRAADLPDWMRTLRDRYLQTETGQFVLHGNVHDLVLCAGRVWSLPRFLDAFFAPSGKLVVHYDPGRGIWFPDVESTAKAALALMAQDFVSAAKVAPRGADKTPKAMLAKSLMDQIGGERKPEVALEILQALLETRDLPVAAIIHYAELAAPDGPSASLGFYDRTAGATLHRWSLSEDVVGGDNLVLMVTGARSDLSRR